MTFNRDGQSGQKDRYIKAIGSSRSQFPHPPTSLIGSKGRQKNTPVKMPSSLSLSSVNAVLIMSTDDSSRIFAKYYSPPHPPAGTAASSTDYPGANPYPNVKDQKTFEKGLLDKTAKQTTDIILYDNRVVVFKLEGDVMLYVVGGSDENEVLLYNVVIALRDALGLLLR